jgi:RNA polymerase sigma-70 factor (ECF subfamily)
LGNNFAAWLFVLQTVLGSCGCFSYEQGIESIVADDEGIITYIPHLRRYARALTGDHVSAEDLVQDTLERAWQRMALWRPGTNIRAWLFTIMHNLYVNQIKASARGMRRSENPTELDVPVSAAQDDRLELRDLNRALQQLPHEQREVVLLIGLEQLSYDQAAKVLGVPIGTVMSRLSRGREQLRSIMSRGGSSPQLKVIK